MRKLKELKSKLADAETNKTVIILTNPAKIVRQVFSDRKSAGKNLNPSFKIGQWLEEPNRVPEAPIYCIDSSNDQIFGWMREYKVCSKK